MLFRSCFAFLSSSVLIAGEGKFINPITDICWSCMFPVHVSGVNVTASYKEIGEVSRLGVCGCVGFPPKLGIPLAFWEPTALIDVTRTPYELTAWGGVSISKADIRKRGAISHVGDGGRTSFYNVHYYNFPLILIDKKVYTYYPTGKIKTISVGSLGSCNYSYKNSVPDMISEESSGYREYWIKYFE